MDNNFFDDEKLYRAVHPASYMQMYWKNNGSISSAAFLDDNGLSVERGYYRDDNCVIDVMRHFFKGCIVSLTVGDCHQVNAVVKYKPTERSEYHSEIHGSDDKLSLSKSQRKRLALAAKIEHYEK